MSTQKIIQFSSRQHINPRREKVTLREKNGVIIDRRNFHHWMRKEYNKMGYTNLATKEKFTMMQERLGRIKIALETGAESEVVTQSARIAILADQLGLPRTAALATEIGEAQMSGFRDKALRLARKLDDIIEALDEDFKRHAES